MKITDLLSRDGISINANVADRDAAIEKLVELHSKVGNLSDAYAFKDAIRIVLR